MLTSLWIDDAELDKPAAARVASYNQKFFREHANEWVMRQAQSIIREASAQGYEVDPVAWLKDPNFNLKQVGKGLRESKYRLSETAVTSMLYSLANVATLASAASNYKLAPVIYRDLCNIRPSKKSEETNFVMSRGDLPAPVGETGAAPESRIGGSLTRIKNYDFARIWSVSRNLEEDDQTGQLANMGQMIGEGMAYAEELYAIYTFFFAYQAANIRPGAGAGVAGSGIIPPRCIAGQGGTVDGGPATTAGDVTLAACENALQAMDYITDAQGNYALPNANSIMVAGSRRINARKIFGSPNNPGGYSTLAATGGQGGIAGVGALAINPLNGELVIHHSPFVSKVRAGLDATNPPWAIGEAGKGWVFQDREPLEVIREVENSGDSFRRRTNNTRAWRRFGAGIEAGEYWFAGN